MITPPGILSRRDPPVIAHPPTDRTLAEASLAVKPACRKGTFLSLPRCWIVRSASDTLVECRALPRVRARRGGGGWRRGLAHEPRQCRHDRGGLLLGGGGCDDRQLRAAVHGQAWPAAPVRSHREATPADGSQGR